jgi:uncharacterized membrane protein YbhN (UPF0104 family)
MNQLRQAITIQHYGYLSLGIGSMSLMPILLAIRLAYVARTNRLGMTACIFKAFFFNNLIPAQIGGDLYKIVFLNKRLGEKERVLAAVFGDRLIGITGLLSLSIVCVVLGYRFFTDLRIWMALGVYLAIVLGIYVTVFFLPLAWLHRLLDRKRLRVLMEKIDQTRKYVRQILSDRLWVGLGLTYAAYGMLIIVNTLIMKSLGLKVDPLASLLYIPVISVAVITLPISFNGLGVRESLFILFFRMAGYTEEQALAMALMNLLSLLIVSVIGGLLMLVGGENPAAIRAERDVET